MNSLHLSSRRKEEHKPNPMIQKALRVLVLIVVILAWDRGFIASSQQQDPQARGLTLFAAATLGASLGAFAGGFFEGNSAWLGYCNEIRRFVGQEPMRPPTLMLYMLHYIEQYKWERYVSMMLAPALGATAGIVALSHMKGLTGNVAMALVGGFFGVGLGLVSGCSTVQIARKYSERIALEFISTTLTIVFSALGATSAYDAQSPSRASRREASALPAMSVTVWSLRF